MLDQFNAEYKSLDFASCEAKIKERYGVEMSDYDIVNLASIVEREGLNADQRAHVASVSITVWRASSMACVTSIAMRP